jgi:hypothetical protein
VKQIAYCAFFAWLLAQASAGITCLAGGDGKDSDSGKTKNVLRIDDIYPVYGPCGSRRHTAFVAGEKMYFAAKISGIAVASDDRPDLDCTYSLVDSLGKNAEGSSGHVSANELLCLGGNESVIHSSIATAMSSHAGQYTLRFTVRDKLANQSATKEIPVDLLEKKRFRVLNVGLYCDREHACPSDGTVTLGEGVYMGCEIRVPKNAKNESIAEVSSIVLDSSDKIIEEAEPQKMSQDNIDTNGCQFSAASGIIIHKSGSYRILIRARNLSTNEMDSCELPLIVVDAPVLSAAHAKVAASLDSSNASRVLLIDAFPTLGRLGGPCDATIISGESRFFFVILRGLTPNSEQRADCTVELSIVNSQFSICNREEQKVKGLLLSHDKSLAATALCRGMAEPGLYVARFAVKDNITKDVASKNITIRVVDRDRFALGGLSFCRDGNGTVPASPNLAIGNPVYACCGIYLPKKSNGHDVEMTASFLDAKRQGLTRTKPHRMNNVTSVASYRYASVPPVYAQAFTPNRPGSYFVRLELKDLVTQETVSKEMPFNVFLPPELPETKKTGEPASRGN